MKIIAIGDMHLGRLPSRLAPDLPDNARDYGPSGAWERAVQTALDAGVTAVLLAGDVVEREDDFFEAYRELERGVKKLADAGIAVIGVAGNHDVKVLPRLAKQLPRFRLLGAGGNWEPCLISDGKESVTLWGWSFPSARVNTSPLQDTTFARAPGLNLGLLHCDRDGGASDYAPVTNLELERARLDGWLLGHIHKPDALSEASPNGYLGSLTGLDPGESGPRGPWIATIAGGRLSALQQLPLAPLRWERLDVDIADISEPVEVKERLLQVIRNLDEQVSSGKNRPKAVGLRITFTGRTRFGSKALREISQEDRNSIYSGTGNTHYFIEDLRTGTRPEIDLQTLAQRPDPPGLLARRLLWLDRPEGHRERDELVARARERLQAQAQQPRWADLPGCDPDPVQWLRASGFRALDRLLAQSGDPD